MPANSQGKAKKDPERIKVEVLQHEADGEDRYFGKAVCITNFNASERDKAKAKEVQTFFENTKIRKLGKGQQGVTWLELYTLYKMSGGNCMREDPENEALAKPAMRVQLKTFKAICRRIARLTMDEDDAKLFRANKERKPRLKKLEISTHMAMLNFQIVINTHTATEMTKHILRSQARRNNKLIQDIIQHKTHVKVTKFSAVNKTAWSRSIKYCKATCEDRKKTSEERKRTSELAHTEVITEVQNKRQKESDSDSFQFSCGQCGHRVPSNRKAFNIRSLDTKTWCNKCKKNWMSKSYSCGCGKPWYKCSVHNNSSKIEDESTHGKLVDKFKAKPGKVKAKYKNQDEDLEGNFTTKKSRTSKTCEPVFRASMLSANLKRKFAHLCED